MSESFFPLCSNCFQDINIQIGGLVLSCGDFICLNCRNILNSDGAKCPGCLKTHCKVVMLSDRQLPQQVKDNLISLNSQVKVLQDAISFQLKHYRISAKRSAEKLINSKNIRILDEDKSKSKENSLLKQSDRNSNMTNEIVPQSFTLRRNITQDGYSTNKRPMSAISSATQKSVAVNQPLKEVERYPVQRQPTPINPSPLQISETFINSSPLWMRNQRKIDEVAIEPALPPSTASSTRTMFSSFKNRKKSPFGEVNSQNNFNTRVLTPSNLSIDENLRNHERLTPSSRIRKISSAIPVKTPTKISVNLSQDEHKKMTSYNEKMTMFTGNIMNSKLIN